jgi:hypothetical protein
LVCLLDAPFDRCPAGFAYLSGLLLRGCWRARLKAANDATTASLIVLMLLVSLNQGFLLARSTRQAQPCRAKRFPIVP